MTKRLRGPHTHRPPGLPGPLPLGQSLLQSSRHQPPFTDAAAEARRGTGPTSDRAEGWPSTVWQPHGHPTTLDSPSGEHWERGVGGLLLRYQLHGLRRSLSSSPSERSLAGTLDLGSTQPHGAGVNTMNGKTSVSCKVQHQCISLLFPEVLCGAAPPGMEKSQVSSAEREMV